MNQIFASFQISKAVLLPLCLFLVYSAFQEGADERTWTDVSGQFKIEATFERIEDGMVVLKTKSGKNIRVALDQLSESDRKFVQSRINQASQAVQHAINAYKANERKLIFADKILSFYQSELENNELTGEVRSFCVSRIQSLETYAKNKALLVGGEFISSEELKEKRSKSHELVNQWYQLLEMVEGSAQSEAFKEASKKIQEARRIDPVSFRADFNLGLANVFVTRKFKRAESHFDNCVERARQYRTILDAVDVPNYCASLNNLALLKIRNNQLSAAQGLWRESLSGQSPVPIAVVENIGRVLLFIDKSLQNPRKSLLNADRKDRDNFQQLLDEAKSKVSGAPTDRRGWMYLPYTMPAEGGRAAVNDNLHVNLLDNVCFVCSGRARLSCTDASCKRGQVPRYKFVQTTDSSGRFPVVQRVRYYVTCPTCGGDTFIDCWGCSGGTHNF